MPLTGAAASYPMDEQRETLKLDLLASSDVATYEFSTRRLLVPNADPVHASAYT